MKSSLSIAVVMSFVLCGCAQQNRDLARMQRENAELKTRVAQLESQVAQLKEQQAQSPITIDGLTLKPLEVGELRLASRPVNPTQREFSGVMGSGQLVFTGTNTYTGNITLEKGVTSTATVFIQKSGGTGWTTTHATTSPMSTKPATTTTTTPAK